MHILGATGSGKTAIGLSTLVPQLIRRGDGAVIVLDCKGDQAFFNTVRIEAERAGSTFKWFTNRLYRSTDYSSSLSNTMHRSARFAILKQTMKGLATQDYEYRAALHLAFIVKSLSQYSSYPGLFTTKNTKDTKGVSWFTLRTA